MLLQAKHFLGHFDVELDFVFRATFAGLPLKSFILLRSVRVGDLVLVALDLDLGHSTFHFGVRVAQRAVIPKDSIDVVTLLLISQ